MRPPDGSVHISGEVIACDPPRKLTITFNVNWPELIEKLGPTLVTYEIEPAGDAVRLTMTKPMTGRSATISCPADARAGPRSSPA